MSKIAQGMKITPRRVQQIWKYYLDTEMEPVIGEDIGRPRKPYDAKEAQLVGSGYSSLSDLGHVCLR